MVRREGRKTAKKAKKKIGFFSFSWHIRSHPKTKSIDHPFSNTIKSISFSIRFISLSLTHTHNRHRHASPAVVGQIFPFSLERSFSVLHFRVHVIPLLFFCKTKNFFSFVAFRLSPIYGHWTFVSRQLWTCGRMKKYMYFEECNELWTVVVHSFFIEPILHSIWNAQSNQRFDLSFFRWIVAKRRIENCHDFESDAVYGLCWMFFLIKMIQS